MANVTLWGASFSDVPAITVPKTGGGTATFYEDGGGGGGSEKAVQVYNGYDSVTGTSYAATDVSLTVAKSGTYNISWVGWRSSSSGTSGSQLYKNGSAQGSAQTTFTGTYGQNPTLSNVALSAGDVLVVRARSRNTSYAMFVANLMIEEV